MKKNIFLYLFIFSLLINVFMYMYFTKQQGYESNRADELSAYSTALKDSLKTERELSFDANYFSLDNDDNAQEYFAGKDIKELIAKIKDGIYELNKNKEGNSLIGYSPINENPFLINKIKVLNNRWVIADFSDGKVWGQVLIKYFLESDGTISYERIETLLYSNTLN